MEATSVGVPQRSRPRPLTVILATWAIVSTIAVGFASYQLYLGTQDSHERTVAGDTARRFVKELTTYGFNDATYEKRVETFSTGKFRKEFEEVSGGGAFAKKLDETKATSRGDVVSVNVESLKGDAATVFVVVDKTVTNSSKPQPSTERDRIELTMVKTVDGWKIDNVTVL